MSLAYSRPQWEMAETPKSLFVLNVFLKTNVVDYHTNKLILKEYEILRIALT